MMNSMVCFTSFHLKKNLKREKITFFTDFETNTYLERLKIKQLSDLDFSSESTKLIFMFGGDPFFDVFELLIGS